MKKKNIKPLVLSSLAALSMGTVSVAGTFALFTDKAETTVQVGSGEIKVNAALDGITLYSADASLTSGDLAGVITGDYAGTYYYKQQIGSFYNGGTASITGTTLSVQRMSPGDKVVTNLGFTNDSNIAIKYRLRVNTSNVHGDELLKNLELKIMGYKYHGLKELQTKWTQIDAGASISGSEIELVLPLETGNEAQAKDANFTFTLEAVQANANVVDLEKAVSYPKEEKLTDAEMASDVVTTAKEIEVPMTAEVNETKTVKVVVPAGANLEEDASSLSLYVENMGEDPTYQGIEIRVDQGAEIYEVTLDGIDEANTAPITVTVNLGYEPLFVYHVHDGVKSTIPFSYNSVTGLTTFTTTNFSEFTFVRDTNIIEIPNLAKLNLVREAVNGGNTLAGKTIKLLTDLDLKNVEWTPIGTKANPFKGFFDGNNKTIKNLHIEATGKGSTFDAQGLFGATENARFANLTLKNIDISSDFDDKGGVGALAGYALNGVTISNVSVDADSSLSAKYAGALVGYTDATLDGSNQRDCQYLVNNSVVHASVTGTRVGGFIGRMDGSTNTIYGLSNGYAIFSDCEFDGVVAASGSTPMAGGFIGQKTGGNHNQMNITFKGCAINDAHISGEHRGDFFGFSQNGFLIWNCEVNDVAIVTPAHFFGTGNFGNTVSINGVIYCIDTTNNYPQTPSAYDETYTATYKVNGNWYALNKTYENGEVASKVSNVWYKVTNAYTDAVGNVIFQADSDTLFYGTHPEAEDLVAGTKLQRRTYVTGYDYSIRDYTHGFDLWRIVSSDTEAQGTGLGQWQDVGNDGASGFVLGAGIYTQDPTAFVDVMNYDVAHNGGSWFVTAK